MVLVGCLNATDPLACIPLSYQYFFIFVIDPDHGLSLASLGFGDALADPLRQLLGSEASAE